MLNIFNELNPFFEDNYLEVGVREYAKLIKVSPPTASTILQKYFDEGLLKKKEERRYHLYSINKQNFKDLCALYWKLQLEDVLKKINSVYYDSVVYLFGSIVKGEFTPNSDVDIVVFSKIDKKIDFKFRKEIQLFVFKNKSSVPKNLLNNILNGIKISGWWN